MTQNKPYTGRSSRKAYWFFIFTWASYSAIASAVALAFELFPLLIFIAGFVLIANINMTARRLNDVGLSGWYQLYGLIPIVGAFIVLFKLVKPGDKEANQYGVPQPHIISTPYILFTYILFILISGALLLPFAKILNFTGKEALALTGSLFFWYLISLIYAKHFYTPSLKIIVQIKRYLFLASGIFSFYLLLSSLNSGGDYEFVNAGLISSLILIVVSLGVVLISFPIIRTLTGTSCTAKVASTLALIFILIFVIEKSDEKSWYVLTEQQYSDMHLLDKLSVEKYIYIFSKASSFDNNIDMCTWSLKLEDPVIAKKLIPSSCNTSHHDFDSYLLDYILDEKFDLASLLLDNGRDINQLNEYDESILNRLVETNTLNDDNASFLSKHGAAIDSKTVKSTLSHANETTISTLLKHFPQFALEYNKILSLFHSGQTLNSADNQNISIATIIKDQNHFRQKGLTGDEIYDFLDRSPLDILADAIIDENQETVDAILSNKDIDLTDIKPGSWSPLMSAAEVNNIDLAKQLLSRGVDINYKEKDDRTALARAIFQSHPEMVAFLVDQGASLTIKGPTIDTPLILAEEKPEIIKILLPAGADPNEKNSYRGETVLHTAARNGNIEIAKLMLEAKADTNTLNRWNDTPLLTAVDNGNVEIIKLLVKNGADLEATKPHDNSTALINAVKANNKSIVTILLENGAKAGHTDMNGNTPLSLAKDQEIIEILQHYQ
jgi:ankyrin repeat protein/uncharacterized membrane protein YhaH (DUF805 family)